MPLTGLVQYYSPIGDTISFFMSVTLAIIFKGVSAKNDKNFRRINLTFIFICAACLCNGAFSGLLLKGIDAPASLFFALRAVYHVSLQLSLFIFLLYCLSVLTTPVKIQRMFSWIGGATLTVTTLLEFLGPLTKFGMYYDPSRGSWVETYLTPYMFGFTMYYCLFGMTIILGYRFILRKVMIIMGVIESMNIILLILQNLHGHNSFTTFTFMMPAMAAMFLLHTNSFDLVTGAQGRKPFMDFLENKIGEYKVYAFVFSDYDYQKSENASVYFCNFWTDYYTDCHTFFIQGDTFLMVTPVQHNADEDLSFMKRAVNGFTKYDLHCGAVLFSLNFPSDYFNFEPVLDYARSKLVFGDACVLNHDDEGLIERRLKILHEIRDIDEHFNFKDERVEVYVQPVKNAKTGMFDTAEALMRLNLPEYGFISPVEFIPIAEKYKYIHSLSLIILDKVCRTIEILNDEGYLLKRVSINFAVQEFSSDNFVDEITEIINKYDIDRHQIAIEVTESENDEEFNLIQQTVEKFKDLEIHMYLDDFGTGYSNFDRLFSLRLNVVKFDRSFLLMADKDEKSKFLIKHFSSAFSQMGYEVLYEGVETDAQEKLCLEANANYLQGYKYSKPIPIGDVRRFLEKRG